MVIVSKEDDVKKWKDSMLELIKSVDSPYYVKTCSISIVPNGLKESNEDVYMPKVVSIGPRFRGAREDLLLMEKVKLHCMSSLLHRSNVFDDANACLEKCSDAILELDQHIRASYVDDMELTRYELAKIMLVDGCFLLELLISGNSELNHELKSRSKYPSLGPEVIKDEEVLSDLILLENQIPVLVLHGLSRIIFPNEFTGNDLQRVTRINDLALSLLGYSQFGNPGAPHLLSLVHSSINLKAIKAEDVKQVVIDINETQQYLPHLVKHRVEVKLKCCATRLEAAGVIIKLPGDNNLVNSYFSFLWNFFGVMLITLGNMLLTGKVNMPEVEMRNFDFDIKFKDGKLEIPQLHITGTTKAKWRNFIALEHHRKKLKSKITNDGKCTWSALFFRGLICCAGDVQLLKDKNIIVDHLNMSNKEIKEYFGTISKGVDHEIVDSSYIKMFADLDNYSTSNCLIRICKTGWHDFTHQVERFITFMGSGYTSAAVLLAFLAIPQTIYAILPYYRPR